MPMMTSLDATERLLNYIAVTQSASHAETTTAHDDLRPTTLLDVRARTRWA
jgi:hypothetical protein